MNLIESEDVEDVIDLNEKFLSLCIGVDVAELGALTKIELRVDTACHNLQVTGEILPTAAGAVPGGIRAIGSFPVFRAAKYRLQESESVARTMLLLSLPPNRKMQTSAL